MDNGRIESHLACFGEKHTVENLTRCRGKPERDIRQTEHGEGAGNLLFDAADRLQSRHAVLAKIFVTGADREGERVEDEIAGRQAVALGGDLVQAVGDFHLPFDIACLATFVDQQTNDSGTVVASQREDAIESAPDRLAIFEVGGVENATTASVNQSRFHHSGFGGVEHQGCARL